LATLSALPLPATTTLATLLDSVVTTAGHALTSLLVVAIVTSFTTVVAVLDITIALHVVLLVVVKRPVHAAHAAGLALRVPRADASRRTVIGGGRSRHGLSGVPNRPKQGM